MNATSTMALFKIMQGLGLFFQILNWMILAYVIMSWIVRPEAPLFVFVSRIVQPIFAPFRPIAQKLMQKGLMIDLSPLIALLALRIIQQLIFSLLYRLF